MVDTGCHLKASVPIHCACPRGPFRWAGPGFPRGQWRPGSIPWQGESQTEPITFLQSLHEDHIEFASTMFSGDKEIPFQPRFKRREHRSSRGEECQTLFLSTAWEKGCVVISGKCNVLQTWMWVYHSQQRRRKFFMYLLPHPSLLGIHKQFLDFPQNKPGSYLQGICRYL